MLKLCGLCQINLLLFSAAVNFRCPKLPDRADHWLSKIHVLIVARYHMTGSLQRFKDCLASDIQLDFTVSFESSALEL